jgi:uncharacterized protein (TIGR03083 family)
MLLTPRYDGLPIVAVEARDAGPHPVMAQRRRLGETLAELTDEQWAHPSRCDGWTVQDVISHLTSTNGFWAFSIQSGVAGEPTRFLSSFDPVASPAELAAREHGRPPAEALEAYLGSVEAMAAVIDGLDDTGWAARSEAPPGHLPVTLTADHALWDAWVHERDIVLPLGLEPTVVAAEVLASLRYGAGLGPAFGLSLGTPTLGAVELRTTDPDSRLVVDVREDQVVVHDGPAPDGTPTVTMDAVTLLELLSRREVGVAEPAEVAWLTAGLAEVFDQTGV